MSRESSRRGLVYVVEDNEEQLMLLRFLLNEVGFDVVTETDADRVLNGVRELRPDLVLLDVMLPSRFGQDGFDLCRQIRDEDAIASTKIVIVSAIAQGVGDQREKVRREVGADDYFVKPYHPSALVNRIRELIG